MKLIFHVVLTVLYNFKGAISGHCLLSGTLHTTALPDCRAGRLLTFSYIRVLTVTTSVLKDDSQRKEN